MTGVQTCALPIFMEHKQEITELQRAYVGAGADIIYAPTFGANRISLAKHGLANEIERMNRTLVEYAKEAADGKTLVAGDITTTGEILEPVGDLTEEDLLAVYREQISYLVQAGADLIIAETLLSVQEAKIVVRAALDVCDLPVMCTLTVRNDGRCLFGGDMREAVTELQELGASAAGINCSAGPEQLGDVVRMMKDAASVPVIVKPNAGLPTITDSGEAVYHMEPAAYGKAMEKLVSLGADIIGGCCGTTPEFIKVLADLVKH